MPAVFKLGTFCILSKSNVSIVVCNLYHFVKSIHACTHIVYWTTFIKEYGSRIEWPKKKMAALSHVLPNNTS